MYPRGMSIKDEEMAGKIVQMLIQDNECGLFKKGKLVKINENG